MVERVRAGGQRPQVIKTWFARQAYVKKILVGAAVFLVSVFLCNLIALSLMWCFPEIGPRFFPENYHTLGWGGYFDFPLWRSWIVGLFICAITFVWMYRKASPRL